MDKIRIRLTSYDHTLIDQAAVRLIDAVKKAGGEIVGPVPLPTAREVVTVIRSPHIDKHSREQFEMRTHKRIIDVKNPSAKIMDLLMKMEMPAGVDIKVNIGGKK